MNKKTTLLTIALLLISIIVVNAQKPTREKFLSEREKAQSELEAAKQNGNKDSIKVAKENYKPYKKLYFAAAPVYLYNPMLLNAVGLSGSFNFNLDKKMGSPMSNITLTALKSLNNSGWLLDAIGWQYLNEDKWRFNERISKIEMEMPVSLEQLGPGMETTMHGDVTMYIGRVYRKIANNFYVGPLVQYNKASMTFDTVSIPGMGEMKIPDSNTEFLGVGMGANYDTRDNKMYATKGWYNFNAFTYLNHALGFKSTNPETGQEYTDPVATYFVGDVKKFYSPNNHWSRTLAFRLKYDFRLGDTGSSQWVNQTTYQRGFKSQAVTGNHVLVLNAEYAHFFNKVLNGKAGVAVYSAYGIYGQGNLSPKFNTKTTSGLTSGSAITAGLGLRYMLLPKQGIVARADWAMGFIPGSSSDQNAWNIGIGRFF
ncbi:hypothetical protein [Maribellus mangrovi]|uniref:hypothetical protein n=1 Tax=Maribellus mangrovi TaxID=3133146 RepID=UPI0030EB2593